MSQIFKTPVDRQVLFDFLDKVALKMDNKYIVSNESYKKAVLNEDLNPFLENIKSHYFLSKKYYLERKPSYKNLATIIRQICRSNNIIYKQKIIYNKSNYQIIYSIFYKDIN